MSAEQGTVSAGSPRRPSDHRLAARLLGGAVLALLLLGVVGGMLLAASALPLLEARSAASDGQAALRAGDLDAGRDHLDRAKHSFHTASLLLGNPVARLAGVIPGLGQNLRTTAALAHAGGLAARSGAGVSGSIADLPGGISSLAPIGGRLPLEPLTRIAPSLERAAGDLTRARELVEGSSTFLLLGPIAEAREEFDGHIGPAADGALAAAALADTLPDFLGARDPRRYFLGAATPAEQRGTGGFIGAYTVLTADDGRLRVGEFRSVHQLPEVDGNVEPPTPDYAARYDRFGGADSWVSVNATPDFPSAATAIGNLYEASVGERLDGVIVADPFMLAALLDTVGPAEIPGLGVTVDRNSVVPFVTNKAYGKFTGQRQRRGVLGAVAAATLQRFFAQGPRDPQAAFRTLAAAAGRGHLQLYAQDRKTQRAFELAGVAGALAEQPGEALTVALNSSTNSKVDYYLRTTITHDVELRDDGIAATVTTVRFRNRAPREGVDEYVIGPNRPGLHAGDNRFFFSLFRSPGSQFDSFSLNGSEAKVRIESESDHPVLALVDPVEVASGEQATLRIGSSAPDTWSNVDGRWTYRLTLEPPTTVQPVRTVVRVRVPEGMIVTGLDDRMKVHGDAVVFDVRGRGRRSVEIVFEEPPWGRLASQIRQFLNQPVVR